MYELSETARRDLGARTTKEAVLQSHWHTQNHSQQNHSSPQMIYETTRVSPGIILMCITPRNSGVNVWFLVATGETMHLREEKNR